VSDVGGPWAEEASAAADAARRAGDLLLGRHDQSHDVAHKGGDGQEPVTDGDLAADELIRIALADRFPGDGILTEESPATDPTAERRWIVDPLDGTANYILKIPFWAVSIAFEIDGDCLVGSVHDPVRDELFEVIDDGPATCNGSRISVSDGDQLETSVASVLLTPSSQAAAGLVSLIGRFRGVRQLGATALELAWVAAGRLDACIFRRNDRIWDWAAGAALVHGAGGTVRPLGDLGQGIVLAAGPGLSETCRAHLTGVATQQVAS
jgi:myo-inositol-1(or 4)-monophosphatase